MARIDTDQSTVIQRVVARLIDQVDFLTEDNCYEAADPDPAVERSHNLFVQVTVGDGQFPDGPQVGGGIHQVFEHASVWVTLFSRIALDHPQQAKQALHNASRGLLALKKQLLQALAGHDLQDASGNEILINYMAAMSSSRPQDGWEGFASISLQFSTDFCWGLSTTTTTTTTTAP